MDTFIALLRGINVGGSHILPMKDLRAILAECGAKEPRTLIQSGNCLFELETKKSAGLGRRLAARIEQDFGFSPHAMVMPLADLQHCLDQIPFDPEEPKMLHVWFLSETPLAPDMELIASLKAPSEAYELHERWFYLHAPEGIGRSKLAGKVEKALGVQATARNLNTLQKLLALARS